MASTIVRVVAVDDAGSNGPPDAEIVYLNSVPGRGNAVAARFYVQDGTKYREGQQFRLVLVPLVDEFGNAVEEYEGDSEDSEEVPIANLAQPV